MRLISLALLLTLASTATADPDRDRLRSELTELAADIKPPPPGPGRDRVAPHAPGWCADVKPEGSWTPLALGRLVRSGDHLAAARVACQWPKEAAIHQVVATIEQTWVNTTGLSAKQAAESLRARLSTDTFAADKRALCDALVVSDEQRGAAKAFMITRRTLFGCVPKDHRDKEPLWSLTTEGLPLDLGVSIDAGTEESDELVRLALAVNQSEGALARDTIAEVELAAYAVDQIDYTALSAEAVMKQLGTAPYKGNSYARTIALESLARAQMAIAVITAEVQRRAKTDEDWKEVLIAAPQRAVAAWTKDVAANREALARSAEFERAFWGPSRKAVKGCWNKLLPDFVAIAKTLDRSSAEGFAQELSASVPSILFTRLVACAAVDGDLAQASLLVAMIPTRIVLGPRAAAYYGALEALGAIAADRPKFPVAPKDLRRPSEPGLFAEAMVLIGALDMQRQWVGADGGGIVKSTRTTSAGVEVVFVSEKHQEMGYDCVETDKIDSITKDGTVVYRKRCKPTGLETVVTTTPSITVPTLWATGIKKGAFVRFAAQRGDTAARIAIPVFVTPNGKPPIVNFLGIAL
jgi:hypothetical protein